MTAKKDPYDKTSTKRQGAHLERLAATQGKRKVIDLDGDRLAKLDELRAAGYGASDAEVFRRALDEAHAKLKRKA